MDPLRKRRAMTADEDPSFDQRVFDARYWPKRVYRDGHGPNVPLMLTDAAPSPSRRQPLMDARMQAHLRVLDGSGELPRSSCAARAIGRIK